MRPRFQADNDLDQRIVVAALRLDPTIDFRTAPAAGLHHMPDDDVLAYASREGRVLVSHDRKTMPEHFGRFISAGETSAGLIIVSTKLPVGRAAEWLHPSVGSHFRGRIRQLNLRSPINGARRGRMA